MEVDESRWKWRSKWKRVRKFFRKQKRATRNSGEIARPTNLS